MLSSVVYAAEEVETNNCDGFWGSLKCFLVGDAENRAGMSWFDRSENLVGFAGVVPDGWQNKPAGIYKGKDGKLYVVGVAKNRGIVDLARKAAIDNAKQQMAEATGESNFKSIAPNQNFKDDKNKLYKTLIVIIPETPGQKTDVLALMKKVGDNGYMPTLEDVPVSPPQPTQPDQPQGATLNKDSVQLTPNDYNTKTPLTKDQYKAKFPDNTPGDYNTYRNIWPSVKFESQVKKNYDVKDVKVQSSTLNGVTTGQITITKKDGTQVKIPYTRDLDDDVDKGKDLDQVVNKYLSQNSNTASLPPKSSTPSPIVVPPLTKTPTSQSVSAPIIVPAKIKSEVKNSGALSLCQPTSQKGLCRVSAGESFNILYKDAEGNFNPVTSIKGKDITYDKSKGTTDHTKVTGAVNILVAKKAGVTGVPATSAPVVVSPTAPAAPTPVPQVIKDLETKCNNDDANACFNLGVKYEFGVSGVDKNIPKSKQLFRKSCLFESGGIACSSALGVDYENKPSIKTYQDKWITQKCPDGVCPTGTTCIGIISSGKCKSNGELTGETVAAMKADVQTANFAEPGAATPTPSPVPPSSAVPTPAPQTPTQISPAQVEAATPQLTDSAKQISIKSNGAGGADILKNNAKITATQGDITVNGVRLDGDKIVVDATKKMLWGAYDGTGDLGSFEKQPDGSVKFIPGDDYNKLEGEQRTDFDEFKDMMVKSPSAFKKVQDTIKSDSIDETVTAPELRDEAKKDVKATLEAKKKAATGGDPTKPTSGEKAKKISQAGGQTPAPTHDKVNEKLLKEGKDLYKRGKIKEAVKKFEEACDKGNGASCANLGNLYGSGSAEIPKDQVKANSLFKKACDDGTAIACNYLGANYQAGEGITKNQAKANELFKKGCENGNAVSCNNLAQNYYHGDGVPSDYDKANNLFEISCNTGNANACASLGYNYQKGLGYTVNKNKAMEHYATSCKLGGDDSYCAAAVGITDADITGVKKYKSSWIANHCTNGKNCDSPCIGTTANGVCTSNDVLDHKTNAEIRKDAEGRAPATVKKNKKGEGDLGNLGKTSKNSQLPPITSIATVGITAAEKSKLLNGGFKLVTSSAGKVTSELKGENGDLITRTWETNGVLGTKFTEKKVEKGKPISETTEFIDKNGKKVYTQITTKDAKGNDITKVNHESGISFNPDPATWDKKTGSCTKGTACLRATSGEFAGRAHLQASENDYDPVPFTVEEFGKGDNIERTLSYQIMIDGKLVEINVDQECNKDCDAGIESDERQVGYKLFTADYTSHSTDYTTGERTHYERSQGLFGQIPNGVGVGCNKATKQCGKNFYFSSDNDYVCTTPKCTSENGVDLDEQGAALGSVVLEDGKLASEKEPKWHQSVCGYDKACIEGIQETNSDRSTQLFFAGKQEWQQAGAQILNGFNGWSGISNALVGDLYANELASDIDRWFAGSILSEEYWESSVCYETPVDTQNDGFAFIERPGGITGTDFVPVAAIQAEMFEEKTPLLCMHNLDEEAEDEFVCPNNLYCNPDDSFCYENEDDETPVKAYFYKISWGVTAPSDLAFTPYGDESSAVEFDLKLGDKRLNDKTIKLKNGETDNNLITHYSNNDYENVQVCIKWKKAPITYSRGFGNSGTEPVKDICYTIKKAEIGNVIFTSDTAAESASVNNGEVTISSSW